MEVMIFENPITKTMSILVNSNYPIVESCLVFSTKDLEYFERPPEATMPEPEKEGDEET